jgi:hypothetical protein
MPNAIPIRPSIPRRAGGRQPPGQKQLVDEPAEHLFGFFSRCYEQCSLIITTN